MKRVVLIIPIISMLAWSQTPPTAQQKQALCPCPPPPKPKPKITVRQPPPIKPSEHTKTNVSDINVNVNLVMPEQQTVASQPAGSNALNDFITALTLEKQRQMNAPPPEGPKVDFSAIEAQLKIQNDLLTKQNELTLRLVKSAKTANVLGAINVGLNAGQLTTGIMTVQRLGKLQTNVKDGTRNVQGAIETAKPSVINLSQTVQGITSASTSNPNVNTSSNGALNPVLQGGQGGQGGVGIGGQGGTGGTSTSTSTGGQSNSSSGSSSASSSGSSSNSDSNPNKSNSNSNINKPPSTSTGTSTSKIPTSTPPSVSIPKGKG